MADIRNVPDRLELAIEKLLGAFVDLGNAAADARAAGRKLGEALGGFGENGAIIVAIDQHRSSCPKCGDCDWLDGAIGNSVIVESDG